MKVFMLLAILFVVSSLSSCATKSIPAEKTTRLERAPDEIKTSLKAAWENEWEKTISLAKREGRVIIYMEGAGGSVFKDPAMNIMRQKYELTVEILALVSAELNARVLIERKAGLDYSDIIITGGGSMANTLIPAGLFGPLEATFILPEVKEEKNWREGQLPWFDKEKNILRSVLLVREGATINTSIVKREELKSYQDLLQPRWKGQIIMYDPTIPGKGLSTFQTIEKLMGVDYLRQLARQEILLSRNHRQLAEWLAHGKYTIGLAVHEAFTQEMQALGTPLDFIEFKEGAGLGSGGTMLGIMDKPPHPNAARVFINWFLTREGQTLWSQVIKYVSRRIDVSTEHVHPITIPKMGVKYVDDDLQYYRDWPEAMKLAHETFVLLAR